MENETQYENTITREYNEPDHKTTSDCSVDEHYGHFGEFYSVGIDDSLSLKEKIADVHGEDSRQVGFVNELDHFLRDNDKYNPAAQKFKSYVRNHIDIPRNTDYLLDEFVNSGYIIALERVRAPNSENTLDYYKDYAASQGISLPQAMLFGPKGSAKQALSYWLTEEASWVRLLLRIREGTALLSHKYFAPKKTILGHQTWHKPESFHQSNHRILLSPYKPQK